MKNSPEQPQRWIRIAGRVKITTYEVLVLFSTILIITYVIVLGR